MSTGVRLRFAFEQPQWRGGYLYGAVHCARGACYLNGNLNHGSHQIGLGHDNGCGSAPNFRRHNSAAAIKSGGGWHGKRDGDSDERSSDRGRRGLDGHLRQCRNVRLVESGSHGERHSYSLYGACQRTLGEYRNHHCNLYGRCYQVGEC